MYNDTKSRFLRFFESLKNGLNKLKFSFVHQRRSRLERSLAFGSEGKKIPNLRQLRYIGLILSPQEKKIINILLLVVFISGGIFAGRWYLQNRVFVPDFGGKYIEGVIGTPRLINPLYAVASDVDTDLASMIYSGLYRVTPSGDVVADVAEVITAKDNGRTVTVKLRDGVEFSSGQPLTANDVVFTYDLVKNTNYQSPLSSYFLNMDFKVVDNLTIEIKLNEPRTNLERYLTVGILPQYIWENVPAASATLAEYNLKPIGSGQYAFKSLTKDKQGVIQSYTLVARKEYYTRRPYLDEVTFKFYSDYDKVASALESHDIDGAAFLPAHLAAPFMNRATWRAHQIILPQYVALYFNPLKNEVFKDSRMREALFLALDRDKVTAEAVGKSGITVNGPLSATLFTDQKEKINPSSPGRAQELFSALGYQMIDGKIVKVIKPKTKKDQPQNIPLTLSITTLDIPEYKKAALMIRDMWQAVGVTVNVNVIALDDPARKETIVKRDFETLIYGSLVGQDLDLTPFWHSQSLGEKGLNLAGLSNVEADGLLEAAAKTDSPDVKKQKYAVLGRILDANRVAIFLWTPIHQYLIDARIKGIEAKILHTPTDRMRGLADWYYKTRRAFKK